MSTIAKQVTKDVKVADIKVGDKLLQDITGVEDRTLIMQGTFISPREVLFLRRQLARTRPTRPPERYHLNQKTPGAIYNKAGECVVRAGQQVPEEAGARLVADGFTEVPGGEAGTFFYRKNEFPKDQPWHINDFNPVVRVETTTYIDEKTGAEAADPRGPKLTVSGAPDKAKVSA